MAAGFAVAGSFPRAGGSGALTVGEVSYVSHNTLYVTSGQGSTVKVTAATVTKVSETVSTSVHSIHPGDTVTVTGSQNKNGSITASSLNINASGSGSGGGGSSESSGTGATQQLFGSG